MKKLILSFSFLLFTLFSCNSNSYYNVNKKILDEYSPNSNYAILTRTGYESHNRRIDFKRLITNRIKKDGKKVELFYSTRYQQTLANNNLYFCYEYKFEDDMGHHALGYVDFKTLDVYLDYFDSERCDFDYNFSTNKYVCYTLTSFGLSRETIDIVFFKETNELKFNYNLSELSYQKEDIEIPHKKEYYIEDGITYQFDDFKRTLTNVMDEATINLPYENDLLDRVPLLKEMYDKFSYTSISILASYISIGEELFFYIHDRPTNHLNAPYMLFKCNMDFSNVEYIGYGSGLITDVVLI